MGYAINLPSRVVLILFAATLLTGLLFALPAGRRGIGKRLKGFVASELDQIYGDGSVRSSLRDLAKWEHCLASCGLLGQATASQSHISGQLTNGTATGYGFGWSVHPESGLVEHSGLWSGYTSQ